MSKEPSPGTRVRPRGSGGGRPSAADRPSADDGAEETPDVVDGSSGRGLSGRGFRILLVGQGVSALGDWMVTVALMALVLDITGSSTAVAGILVLRLAPAALAGPIVTRAVADWDRRRTMLVMDAARAGIVLALPLVRELWWVYLWAFFLELAGLVFLPARDAAIPDLVDEGSLSEANGLVLGSSYGTIPLGAGAFAVIGAVVGSGAIWLVFVVDAATFAASFAAIATLRELGATEHGEHDPAPRFRESFRLPIVRATAPSAGAVALGLGSLFSLGIVFVRQVLDANDTEFAVLVALFGVGAGLGLLLLRRLGEPSIRSARRGVVAQGIIVGGMSLSPGIGPAFAGAVAFGAATAVVLATAMSVLQERLDGEARVMAFAAFHVVIRGGLAVAALASGAAADLVRGVSWPVVGSVPPARLVLVAAGVLVALVGLFTGRHVDLEVRPTT